MGRIRGCGHHQATLSIIEALWAEIEDVIAGPLVVEVTDLGLARQARLDLARVAGRARGDAMQSVGTVDCSLVAMPDRDNQQSDRSLQ